MAAPVGFKTAKGYFFDCIASEEELLRLQGENGDYYSGHIFQAKLKEYNLSLLEKDDSLTEVTVGGYDVVHGVFFKESEANILDVPSPGTMSSASSSASSEAPAQDDVKKSWTTAKVKQLILLFEKHQQNFSNNHIEKKDMWEKIAGIPNSTGGATFTAEEVEKKWRGLKEIYKKIKDGNKMTGRGRSSWEFMDDLQPILAKDPAVNPPCIVSAGAAFSIETAPALASSSSPPPTPSPGTSAPSRRSKEPQTPLWAEEIIKENRKNRRQNKKIKKQLKLLVEEKRRRNNLFEKFLEQINN